MTGIQSLSERKKCVAAMGVKAETQKRLRASVFLIVVGGVLTTTSRTRNGARLTLGWMLT